MANDSIPLREYIEGQFSRFNKKLDYILDPQTGIYKELNMVNQKANVAHSRLDQFEKKKEKKRDVLVKLFLVLFSVIAGFTIKLLAG